MFLDSPHKLAFHPLEMLSMEAAHTLEYTHIQNIAVCFEAKHGVHIDDYVLVHLANSHLVRC